MKALFAHFENFWVFLAFRLSHTPFSFIIVCVAVAVCLISGSLKNVSVVEKAIVFVAAKSKGITERQAEVAVVNINNDLVEEWQGDLYQADSLALLIANILHSSNSTVGLLTDTPITLKPDTLQKLISEASSENKEVTELVRKRDGLVKLLSDPRVVMGASGAFTSGNAIFEQQIENDMDAMVVALNKRIWPCSHCENIDVDENIYAKTLGLGKTDSGFSELWFSKEEKLYPNYLAGLCLSAGVGASGNTDLPHVISPAKALSDTLGCFSSSNIPLRSFVSAYDVLDSYSARTITLNLEEALALSTFPELVLIGKVSDEAINKKIANVVHGLKHQQFLVAPWWAEFALKCVFMVLVLITVFLTSKIYRRYVSLIVLSIAFVAVIGASVGIAIIRELFIPVSNLILFSTLAYMALSLRNIVLRDRSNRKLQLASAIDNSLEFLDSHEAYDESVNLLEHHPNEKLALTKITDICESLAKSPETLSQAISLLESLHPKYRNNKELVSRLSTFKIDLSRTRTLQTAESKQPSTRSILPEKLGRYEIERELGRGAVGIVYLGYDPAISRQVAIKTLDTTAFSKDQVEDLKQRFFREAEAAGRLSHPNIVSVYDVGEEKELAFIAMDYVEGVALSHHVVTEHLLPVAEVYRIVHDVASALSYAHEHQIIHRDIKPGNIMYGVNPRAVKVADFGIARLLDHSRTATGEILGSPLYMSPEQLQGSKVGATADIFSVGVTFYQLLTGHLPFDAANLAGLTYEIIHTKHKNIRTVRKDLPASAARIVNQCLQKSPRDRYQTAHELVAVLRKAIKRDFPDTAKQIGVI